MSHQDDAQACKEMVAEVMEVLAMTPEDVLVHSAKVNPQKLEVPSLPEEARNLLRNEVVLVWWVLTRLVEQEKFDSATKFLSSSVERVRLIESLAGERGFREPDSVRHRYQVLLGNLGLLSRMF